MTISLHKLVPLGIIFVSALFFIAICIWGIFPLQDLVIEKANTIEANRTLQGNEESRIKELPQLREAYNRIVENEGKFDTLVSHDQMVPFIERIEALAHENRLEIVITNQNKVDTKKKGASSATAKPTESKPNDGGGASPSEKKKKDETILGNLPIESNISLRFDVRGGYADTLQFLHQVETLPYAVDVVALDIRSWQSTEKATRGDVFSSGTEGGASPDQLAEPQLVQALFDAVVYTKD